MTARQRHNVRALWPVDEVRPGGAPSWTIGAPCRYQPELFFSDSDADIAAAKATCTGACPLARRIACMDYALDNQIEYGVFGGVSREERIEKQCATCQEDKPLAEFPRHQRSLDGHNPVCWPCAQTDGRRKVANLTPGVETSRRNLAAVQQRQTAEKNERMAKYAQLWWDQRLPRSVVMERLGIGSTKTAQRYESAIREQQSKAANTRKRKAVAA